MKVYEFGADTAPVILLLPGTCCHWKSNFGQVIPLLQRDFRVLCVSYDGFDETESTEFPTMLAETEKLRRAYTGRLRLLSGRLFRGTAGSTEKHTYGLRYSGQLRP